MEYIPDELKIEIINLLHVDDIISYSLIDKKTMNLCDKINWKHKIINETKCYIPENLNNNDAKKLYLQYCRQTNKSHIFYKISDEIQYEDPIDLYIKLHKKYMDLMRTYIPGTEEWNDIITEYTVDGVENYITKNDWNYNIHIYYKIEGCYYIKLIYYEENYDYTQPLFKFLHYINYNKYKDTIYISSNKLNSLFHFTEMIPGPSRLSDVTLIFNFLTTDILYKMGFSFYMDSYPYRLAS